MFAGTPIDWIAEGRPLSFLWVTLGGLVGWLMMLLGHYAAEIGADRDDKVAIWREDAAGRSHTHHMDKTAYQSFSKLPRRAFVALFWIGTVGMTLSALVATLNK